ncbi:MAG: PEP-CTERM sorting domain-containing protein [Oxalobacteraceae bacterium]|nr:MAG: PEP-CTERM sorting domain-containing protein [Oxalobacteraceae bacterium]
MTVRATTSNASYWATVNNLTLGGAAATGAVPEPASWAMMIFGMGAVGGALRRRQKTTTRVAFTA